MHEQLLGIALTYGPKTLVAALMLLGGYFAARWAGAVAGRSLERYELEAPVRALLESAARVLVFGLFIIMALQNIGVELLPLIAGLGVAGAAIALAMQGVLGNIAAGLTIIFSKPFRVGDYVSIAGVHGEVLEIRLSSTTLGHADLSRVVVPNRKIVGEILHNYGSIRRPPASSSPRTTARTRRRRPSARSIRKTRRCSQTAGRACSGTRATWARAASRTWRSGIATTRRSARRAPSTPRTQRRSRSAARGRATRS